MISIAVALLTAASCTNSLLASQPCHARGPCDPGYMDLTDGNYETWACGTNCAGGKYYTNGLCNCACTLEASCDGIDHFADIKGQWMQLPSCTGCSSNQYTVSTGVESSSTSDITTEYSSELSVSVSAGFEFFAGPSVSTEMSASVSAGVAYNMGSSFTHSKSESSTFSCESNYLYQWAIDGVEVRYDGQRGSFQVASNNYLCTNSLSPKCPPGFCADPEDCQYCKAPLCGNMDSECSAEIDWAVNEGKWGHPENYDSFKQVTGVELYNAGTEDMALYFYCTETRPNGNCDELQMPCSRECGTFEACGYIPDSCQSEIDWAVNEGKWGHPEFYPHFTDITGVQLSAATTEDILLFWHCASINPNGNCAGLEIPCNRQCAV